MTSSALQEHPRYSLLNCILPSQFSLQICAIWVIFPHMHNMWVSGCFQVQILSSIPEEIIKKKRTFFYIYILIFQHSCSWSASPKPMNNLSEAKGEITASFSSNFKLVNNMAIIIIIKHLSGLCIFSICLVFWYLLSVVSSSFLNHLFPLYSKWEQMGSSSCHALPSRTLTLCSELLLRIVSLHWLAWD